MTNPKAPQVVAVDIDNEQELSIFVTTLNASLHAVGIYSGRNLMRPAEAKVTMQMVALAQSLQTVDKQDINKTLPSGQLSMPIGLQGRELQKFADSLVGGDPGRLVPMNPSGTGPGVPAR